MLYSNQSIKAAEKQMDFGTLYQISMGEEGRGRRLMSLVCPKDTVVKNGINPNLTISKTLSGKPRINTKADNTLYLMLSAKGGYTRRGNGTIKILQNQKENFEVLARGNGADGEAGRIGYWDCLLLKAPTSDAIVRVQKSGAGYGIPSDLYIIHEGAVYHCHINTIEECCEALGIQVPCEIVNGEDGLAFGNDWITI